MRRAAGGEHARTEAHFPRFLTHDERISIADGLAVGKGVGEIAAEIGRHRSTVSREVRRNSDPETGAYAPWRAGGVAAARRARPKPRKINGTPELRGAVREKPSPHWSPEQISHWPAPSSPIMGT